MKKIVQRIALMALMLLPMLANATVPVPTVNYAARGTVAVIEDEDVDFDIVRLTPNTGYLATTPDLWDIVGATIDGTDVKVMNTYELWVRKTNTAITSIRVKFAPQTPTLALAGANGTFTDNADAALLGSYTYGTHIYVKAAPAANYQFTSAEWTDVSSNVLGSYNGADGVFDFYITENTTLTGTFSPAVYTLTVNSTPDNSANITVGGATYSAPVEVPYSADPNLGVYIDAVPDHYQGYNFSYVVNGAPVASGDASSPELSWGVYTIHTIGPDAVLTVTYTPKNYNITVNSDDLVAGSVSAGGSFPYGSTQTITATPSDPVQYRFKQWNDGNTDNPRTINVEGDATYTAFFDYMAYPITLAATPAGNDGTFSVKVEGEDADFVAVDPSREYYYGSQLQLRANDGTNYHFTKWSDESTENPRTVYVWNASNVNLTAVYTPNTYAVSFADGYAGKLTLSGDGSYAYGTEVTVTAAPVNADEYEFAGWQVGGITVSTNASYTFTVDGAVGLTALFQGVEYTVNAVTNTGDNSEGTVSPISQNVRFGETFSLTATPATGYVFKHWNEATNYGDMADVTDLALDVPNAGHEYTWTASFGPQSYTITLATPDAHFGIAPDVASIPVDFNGSVDDAPAYTNTDATKYTVTGWADANNDDVVFPYTHSIAADATWHPVVDSVSYTLTLTHATCDLGTSVKYNTKFTLTPDAIDGKEFKNWKVDGVDGSTEADYEFTMANANMAIEAVYDDVTYTVEAIANPAGAATFTGTGTTFTYGATTTVVATMDEHYTFVGWNDSETSLTHSPITVTDNVSLTANFTPNTYNISVAANDANMGTVSCDVDELAYGEAMNSHLTVTENAGYYLKEWRTGEDVVISTTDMLTWTYNGTATLTAVFDYEDITVTTEALDSIGVADLSAYEPVVDGDRYVGGIVTTTAQDITGWHFKNWENGSEENPRVDTLTAVAPTFSATYARNVYTVTLNVDENKGENATGAGEYRFEDVVTLAVDAKYGYSFTGWKDAEDNDVVSGFAISDNMELTAQFTTNQYTVTPVAGANGSVTPDVATPVDYNNTITLTADPDFGYKLTNWSNNDNSDTYTTLEINPTVTKDITWTAAFELYDFNITVNVPADDDEEVMGTVAISGDKKLGGTFTLTPIANPGYEFVKFTGEETGTDYTTAPYDFSVTAEGDDTTFTAVFQRAEFTVAAGVNEALMGSVAPASTTAAYKTAVTLTASPVAGYEVENWTNNVDATTMEGNSIEVTVPAQNITWTANFVPSTYTIAAVANTSVMGTATVNGETETTAVFGSPVTLAYTANEGYAFDNWTDPDGNEIADPSIVTVPVDGGTYTANFHALQFNITLAANFDARGTVEFDDDHTSAKLATFGESYAITATPAYGYVFTGWSDGEEGTNLTRTVTLPSAADYTLTANFDYQPYTITVNYNADSADVTVNGVAYTEPVEISYTQVANIVVTPKEHYHIVNGLNPYTHTNPHAFDTTVLSNIEFNFVCLPDTHAITFDVAPAASYGSITGGVSGDYAYGTEIEVTAVPSDEHYSFVKWEDNSTEATRTITVEDDATFTATFEAMKYQFTVSSDNTEMGNVTGTASGEYDYMTHISIDVTPEAGYHFVNWVDGQGNDLGAALPYEFDLVSNSTIKAVFTNDLYTLRLETPVREMGWLAIDGDSAGYVANGYIERQVPSHTDIAITAMPNYGYNFGAWNDDATADSVRTIQVSADLTLTAIFGYNTYEITLDVNDAERGTADFVGTANFNYGFVNNIEATPAAGFEFRGWDDGNTDNPREITVTAVKTYTAIFGHLPLDKDTAACNEVVWEGDTYTTDGIQTKTLTDKYGLDSVVNMNITVYVPQNTTEDVENCFEYDWTYGTDTYTESGTYTADFTDANGCAAVHTLNLTIFEQQGTKYTIERCAPYTWGINGVTYVYDENGVYVEYTSPELDVNGCEKRDTLELTFTTPQNVEETVTACDSYTWNLQDGLYENVYDASGDYSIDGYIDQNQCAATATLHLTIQESIHETLAAVDVCDEYTWTYNSTEVGTYNESGDQLYEWNDGVCDNSATLPLTIRHNSNTIFDDVTACDTYQITWADATEDVTVSGTYTHDYTSVEGCPSTDEITVTINNSNTGTEDTTVCDTYTWINGETYTESVSGVEYTIAGGNMVGCDSTVTLNLTINKKVEVVTPVEACVTYNWNGLDLTTSGDYTMNHNGEAANGCDSIDILRLTINQPQVVELPAVTACESYEYNGVTYTASAELVFDTTDIHGCDSTTTLSLTINTPVNTTESAIECESYTWAVDGETYTTSGTYTADITDANGCAATATLNLTINNGEDVEISEVACETYHWDLNNTDYTESGDYSVDVNDGNGCAYTATLHLTVNQPVTVDLPAVTACGSYEWNNVTYTASEELSYTTTAANGCDSTTTLSLTINQPVTVALDAVTACESYEWNGTVYTASEELSYTTTAANGCDSTTTLSLTINTPVNTEATEVVCDTYTWTVNGQTYTTSGTYTADITDANGCAATATLILTVNSSATNTEAMTACNSYSWNGQTYTTSGSYTWTGTTDNGCDSTVTLNLTVNNDVNITVAETACDSYVWATNGVTYTTSGTYSATISGGAATGCDSTVTLNLTVNQSVTNAITLTGEGSVEYNGVTYTADDVVTVTYTAANGCDSVVTATIIVTPVVVEPDTLTVVLTINDATMGTTTPAPGTYYFAAGDTIVATATANEGYTFVGWEFGYSFMGVDLVDTITTNPISEVVEDYYFNYGVETINVNALFEADTTPVVTEPDSVMVVTIVDIVYSHGTIANSADTNLVYLRDGDSITVTATPDTDYEFAYFSIRAYGTNVNLYDTAYTSPYTLHIDSTLASASFIAIKAHFTSLYGVEDSVTVNVATADANMGTTNPVPGTYRVALDEQMLITPVANEGYHFDHWVESYTLGDSNYVYEHTEDTIAFVGYAIMLNLTFNYTAYFVADSIPVDTNTYYHITMISADSTMGTVAPSDSATEGSRFTAYAIANEGFRFVNWTNEAGTEISTQNPYIFTVVEDVTLIANFEVDSTPVVDTVYYNITVNYDATMGTVTGEGRYVEGTIVTLRATANEGYTFVGWYDGDNVLATTPEYTFTLNADVTFNAVFEALPVYYTVTGMPNDSTMGEVFGSGEYEENATATLTAQAYDGYHFVRWSNGETTPTITFTVTEDVTVIAIFEVDTNPQAIDETDLENVTIYSAETRIIVTGAEGKTVNVYDINGRTVSTKTAAAETVEFRMATTGVYLVKVGNAPAKRVLVVR